MAKLDLLLFIKHNIKTIINSKIRRPVMSVWGRNFSTKKLNINSNSKKSATVIIISSIIVSAKRSATIVPIPFSNGIFS